MVESSIDDLRRALESGAMSSVELVALYLNSIASYDHGGIRLNSMPVLNPAVFDEAALSDRRRSEGRSLGVMEGIPFTVKDSFKVQGMAVAAGSPAFENLVANEDAFTVARLRDAGGVLIGKTNMPPMAAGGMQRGVYGRAESSVQPRLPGCRVRLRLLERLGYLDGRELRRLRTGRGDALIRTVSGIEQRAGRLHTLPRCARPRTPSWPTPRR